MIAQELQFGESEMEIEIPLSTRFPFLNEFYNSEDSEEYNSQELEEGELECLIKDSLLHVDKMEVEEVEDIDFHLDIFDLENGEFFPVDNIPSNEKKNLKFGNICVTNWYYYFVNQLDHQLVLTNQQEEISYFPFSLSHSIFDNDGYLDCLDSDSNWDDLKFHFDTKRLYPGSSFEFQFLSTFQKEIESLQKEGIFLLEIKSDQISVWESKNIEDMNEYLLFKREYDLSLEKIRINSKIVMFWAFSELFPKELTNLIHKFLI
jgi:hypothetical protein